MLSHVVPKALPFCVLSLFLLVDFGAVSVRADSYDDLWMECHYITQCSASSANATIHFASDRPAYGIFNDWVDSSNNARPATWQRFVDTSGYFIIATEELVFSSTVDFAF
jgi:hypothetical protein